jgi:hypothetical protein
LDAHAIGSDSTQPLLVDAGVAYVAGTVVVTMAFNVRRNNEVADRLVELALGDPVGLVPGLGGPEGYSMPELVRGYLEARGKHRPILAVSGPGVS